MDDGESKKAVIYILTKSFTDVPIWAILLVSKTKTLTWRLDFLNWIRSTYTNYFTIFQLKQASKINFHWKKTDSNNNLRNTWSAFVVVFVDKKLRKKTFDSRWIPKSSRDTKQLLSNSNPKWHIVKLRHLNPLDGANKNCLATGN